MTAKPEPIVVNVIVTSTDNAARWTIRDYVKTLLANDDQFRQSKFESGPDLCLMTIRLSIDDLNKLNA